MFMKVLLSIRPEHVRRILERDKRYEYRKRVFKKHVDVVVIYSTMPVGRIVGEFKLGEILHCPINHLWAKTREYAGVDYGRFCSYFEAQNEGYALEIEEVKAYKNPVDPWKAFDGFRAPQSFCYIDDNWLQLIPGRS